MHVPLWVLFFGLSNVVLTFANVVLFAIILPKIWRIGNEVERRMNEAMAPVPPPPMPVFDDAGRLLCQCYVPLNNDGFCTRCGCDIRPTDRGSPPA